MNGIADAITYSYRKFLSQIESTHQGMFNEIHIFPEWVVCTESS